MAGEQQRVDETAEMAEIVAMIRRTGMALSGKELAELVDPYRRQRAALEALRAELDVAEEPAVIFEA